MVSSPARTVFDLHVHTLEGSRDSSLRPEELVTELTRLGVDGAVLAEHDGWHSSRDFVSFASRQNVILVRALEVYTDVGHVIALGMREYEPGMQSIARLRKIIDAKGGFMILAHPFRFLFDPHGLSTRNILYPDPTILPGTPTEASTHEAFVFVDDIEALNAANNDHENEFALTVANILGWSGTGGSDAHSVHGIGRAVTTLNGTVRHERDLLDALRARVYSPAELPST